MVGLRYRISAPGRALDVLQPGEVEIISRQVVAGETKHPDVAPIPRRELGFTPRPPGQQQNIGSSQHAPHQQRDGIYAMPVASLMMMALPEKAMAPKRERARGRPRLGWGVAWRDGLRPCRGSCQREAGRLLGWESEVLRSRGQGDALAAAVFEWRGPCRESAGGRVLFWARRNEGP